MNRFIAILAVLPLVFGVAAQAAGESQRGSAYNFVFQAIEGKPLPLAEYRGKAVLVVNVASFCGFTHQYTGLQALYEKYAARGLVVLGVPANDFGEQEPGTNAEIVQFCQGAFNVTFPLTEKVVVKGKQAHPFYAWAKDILGKQGTPAWNFHKLLVGRDGHLLSGFASAVEPDAPEIVTAIEAALGAGA